MTTRQTSFGPISRIYIGPGPMTDDALTANVLKRIRARRTKGGFLVVDRPKIFVACRGRFESSAPDTLSFTLTFEEASDDVIKLAKGIQISDDTDISDPAGGAEYTVLVLGPDRNSNRNYLIPNCQTIQPITDNFEKRATYNQSINFSMQETDPNFPLYSQGTASELATILDGRSPI